jgi:hypothetical protein
MMPTTTQMLAAVQLALREHVTPQIEDQWAQSALRSVDVILNHLQARVPAEGPMLHQDTNELVALLTEAHSALGGGDPSLEAFLAEAPTLLAGYASVDDLQAINHKGREAVDVLLLACHAQRGHTTADAIHADLRAYLLRHAERESGFFFPTYVGRPV